MSAGYEEMIRHPYLSRAVASNIIRFREEYRQFRSIDELMNLELIDGVLFSKIVHYLKVDED
jgi:DNA uptake protein ComE-like DNA-binding protein